MKVVAVLSEKGGAGKTTLSVHLATAAQLAGNPAALLDLDPQGSAFAWAERRTVPPEAQAILPVALPGWLKKLDEAGAGLVVLDTGRDSNNAGYTAAKAADWFLSHAARAVSTFWGLAGRSTFSAWPVCVPSSC